MQTTTDIRTTGTIEDRPRRAAWVLALSPALFVLWLAATVATMSGTGVSESADLVPAQMASIRGGWALIWPLYGLAVVAGDIAMAVVNQRLRQSAARGLALVSQVAVGVSIAAILANLVLSEVAGGFTEPRLGDNAAFGAAVVASYVAIWAALAGVAFTGLALRRAGTLRRTGTAVAIIAVIVLALDAATRGFPPFVIALLWLPLGVGLLRRRVPSSR